MWIARLILAGALLSLFKVFNGNFVAATRLVYALGQRALIVPRLGEVNPRFGAPGAAILFVAAITAAGAFLGDAVLVPISEVGAGVGAVGWFAACLAFLALSRSTADARGKSLAVAGAAVSVAIVVIKVVPGVPGSFGVAEWGALGCWCVLGLLLRSSRPSTH
jgi:amino acid transporter